MGYTEDQAREAYQVCGKSEERAANYLIDNCGQLRSATL